MESSKRGDFQNSNSGPIYRRFSDNKQLKQDVGDKLVSNFIWAHNHWLEKRVLERLNIGDGTVIQEALSQIHTRSLEANPFRGTKTFSEVVMDSKKGQDTGMDTEDPLDQSGPKETEWQQVSYKKKQMNKPRQAEKEKVSIFLHNISESTTSSQIWSLFKPCGHIIDIILPKRRDVKGKRYGFVHTISELEAGAIINNAKMDRSLGGRISMTINGSIRQHRKEQKNVRMDKSTKYGVNMSNNKEPKDKPIKEVKDDDFGKKMFEFTELEIDEEVEEALMECRIGFSWFDESAATMQEKLNDTGLTKYKVTSLSKRKFLIRKDVKDSWGLLDKTDLSVWFCKIRSYTEADHVISRVTWIECKGLPMPAWKEENLKALTSRFGEWISWTYQSDGLSEFFNPLICIDTTLQDKICDNMQVLYKGSHKLV